MIKRFGCALVVALLCVSALSAQTVRFDTNVGTFDLDLNPTGNVNLQGHVDNILAYVNGGRYNLTVINRAVDRDNADPNDDFVLQMGGFLADSLFAPSNFNFAPVQSLDPVIVDTTGDNVIDFDTVGLQNARGTVTLALGSSPTTAFRNDPGTPLVNSGTSSFFVNLGDNGGLDPGTTRTVFEEDGRGNPVFDANGIQDSEVVVVGGFLPFATIVDMSTIDLILRLNQLNLPNRFAGDLGGDDVPLVGANGLVIVERAFVVPEPFIGPVLPGALIATGNSTSPLPPPAVQALSVPEPPALVIAVGAIMLLAALKRGKIA